ncbi:hypothetical protein BH18CHL2_BH18CHL2_09340 [soil metagenome]
MATPPRLVPAWATQLLVGLVVVLIAVALFSALLGTAVRGPSAFLDELGKTVSRAAPQPQADLRSDANVKAVIEAMPGGRLRVASIVEEQDRVVFTITADRGAVKAAVRPGDELRVSRSGEIEIAPTWIPALLDGLQRAVEDLRQRFFGR